MSSWYIGIRIEQSAIGFDFSLIANGELPFVLRNFGHVMVTITDPDGDTEVFGWMPNPVKRTDQIFESVAGKSSLDQTDHTWAFEKRVSANADQVLAIREFVEELEAIRLSETGLTGDEQTLRYYAAPVLLALPGKRLFNCVAFAHEALTRAGVTSLTNVFTPLLSPGAIPRDDSDLRQQSALAGVDVSDGEFVEAQSSVETMIYDFSGIGETLGTDETVDDKHINHPGDDLIVVSGDGVGKGKEGADWLFAGKGDNYLFGEEGADRLRGVDGRDVLDGGDNNDILNGDAGVGDYLIGGDGNDEYRVISRQGNDVIFDEDGEGSIKFDKSTLTGGKNQGKGQTTWYDDVDNPTWQYSASATPNTRGSGAGVELTVLNVKTGSATFIEQFYKGDLGINLEDGDDKSRRQSPNPQKPATPPRNPGSAATPPSPRMPSPPAPCARSRRAAGLRSPQAIARAARCPACRAAPVSPAF